MIYLTFYHDRNVFKGSPGSFVSWIKNNFQTVKFEGFECGRYFPTISISLSEFQAKKEFIPTKNIVRVEGKFTVLQSLMFGVRDFKNEVDELMEKGILEFNNETAATANQSQSN